MVYYLRHFFLFIIIFSSNSLSYANMTLEELFFDESRPYETKLLEALPEKAIIQIGPTNAKNTIIEFMDYFCGYCKKVHPELMQLANKRDDVRIVFLQHPVLGESSKIISLMVIAANIQGKGLDMHNELFSIEGSLNKKKLEAIMDKININKAKLNIDINKEEINNIVKLSAFLANGSGARGTPTFLINGELVVGYLPSQRLEGLLK